MCHSTMAPFDTPSSDDDDEEEGSTPQTAAAARAVAIAELSAWLVQHGQGEAHASLFWDKAGGVTLRCTAPIAASTTLLTVRRSTVISARSTASLAFADDAPGRTMLDALLPQVRERFRSTLAGASTRFITLPDIELAVVLMRLLSPARSKPAPRANQRPTDRTARPVFGARLAASWPSTAELSEHPLFSDVEANVAPRSLHATAAAHALDHLRREAMICFKVAVEPALLPVVTHFTAPMMNLATSFLRAIVLVSGRAARRDHEVIPVVDAIAPLPEGHPGCNTRLERYRSPQSGGGEGEAYVVKASRDLGAGANQLTHGPRPYTLRPPTLRPHHASPTARSAPGTSPHLASRITYHVQVIAPALRPHQLPAHTIALMRHHATPRSLPRPHHAPYPDHATPPTPTTHPRRGVLSITGWRLRRLALLRLRPLPAPHRRLCLPIRRGLYLAGSVPSPAAHREATLGSFAGGRGAAGRE